MFGAIGEKHWRIEGSCGFGMQVCGESDNIRQVSGVTCPLYCIQLKALDREIKALQLRAEEEDLAHLRRGYERGLEEMRRKERVFASRYDALVLFNAQSVTETRESLFDGAKGRADESSARISGKARQVNESKDYTASLQRMQRRVAEEMKRLDGTQSLLQQDARRVTETMEKTEQYKEKTGAASRRLSSIHAKQQREYFYGRIGAAIFLLTILYIISKRIPRSVINAVVYLFTPPNATDEEGEHQDL